MDGVVWVVMGLAPFGRLIGLIRRLEAAALVMELVAFNAADDARGFGGAIAPL